MRIAVLFPLLTLLIGWGAVPAFAQEEPFDGFSSYYEELEEESGAEDLPYELPEEARDSLGELGVDGPNWDSLSSLSPEAVFSLASQSAAEASRNPVRAGASVLAVILLCALLNGMKLTFAANSLSQAAGLAATLCVAAVVVRPIVGCVQYAASIVQAAAGFQLACVPVLGGILLAAGEPAKALSYETLTALAGNAVSLVANYFLVPLISCFLALSLVSAVCPAVPMNGLCELIAKAVKWILGFCMTLFTGLLTVHSLVTASADSAASRAVKFAVSSFVPVVGGALGEALRTVGGCIGVLKSGVAAFVLLAEGVLFLPAILQCVFWQLTLLFCSAVGEALGQKELSALLSAAGKAVGLLLAILLCCALMMTVTSVALILVGGGAS